MSITIYRTRVTKLPGDLITPDYWRVELMTHTEDGPQVEFAGDYFNEEDAKTIMQAWRSAETRHIVFLSTSLLQPAWHDNQGDGE